MIGAELQVVETVYKLGDGTLVVKEPKTPHSRRRISLPPSLALLLREYRSDHQDLGRTSGTRLNGDDFVFCRADGRPLDPSVVTRTFTKMVKKAGLGQVRLHDLRHTHATLMLKEGVHPKVVSERLGHAGVGITLDTYSHVLPGLQEEAAEKFDRLLDERHDDSDRGPDVSKMFADGGGVEPRPCRARTCDTLIKSHGVSVQAGKEVKCLLPTP